MRHTNTQRRKRNRNNQNGHGGHNGGARRGTPSRSHVYDSNGPDVRIRGTAYQITEKYLILAKDALSSGNNVLAESYYQHAEHYQRIINNFEVEAEVKHENNVTRTPQVFEGGFEDDLSLPTSILGGSSNVEPKVESFAG